MKKALNKMTNITLQKFLQIVKNEDLLIIEDAVSKMSDVNDKDIDNNTALHHVVQMDRADVVAKLLAAGADISLENKQGENALWIAARSGSASVIPLLVKEGLSIDDDTSTVGNSLLHVAASNNRVNTVKTLIELGAEINVADEKGNTPLHDAVVAAKRELVELLIAHGANLNWGNKSGHTPYQWYLSEGNFYCEELEDLLQS